MTVATPLLAEGVVQRLEDSRLDCVPPLTLKQRAKAFVESSVVYEYPKGGWRGQSPPDLDEDEVRGRFMSHSVQPITDWQPAHDMPEHLWRYERATQWSSCFARHSGPYRAGSQTLVAKWRGGYSPRVWRVHVCGVSEPVGWVMGSGMLNRWGAYFPDGVECLYLAGPWEQVAVRSRWRQELGVRVVHPTRWGAAFAVFSGLIDAYGPHDQNPSESY